MVEDPKKTRWSTGTEEHTHTRQQQDTQQQKTCELPDVALHEDALCDLRKLVRPWCGNGIKEGSAHVLQRCAQFASFRRHGDRLVEVLTDPHLSLSHLEPMQLGR